MGTTPQEMQAPTLDNTPVRHQPRARGDPVESRHPHKRRWRGHIDSHTPLPLVRPRSLAWDVQRVYFPATSQVWRYHRAHTHRGQRGADHSRVRGRPMGWPSPQCPKLQRHWRGWQGWLRGGRALGGGINMVDLHKAAPSLLLTNPHQSIHTHLNVRRCGVKVKVCDGATGHAAVARPTEGQRGGCGPI